MQQTTIVATMADGTRITERTTSFEGFTAIVLPLWHDPDCLRLAWYTTPAPRPVRQADQVAA